MPTAHIVGTYTTADNVDVIIDSAAVELQEEPADDFKADMRLNFGVLGGDRKALAAVVGEILGVEMKYSIGANYSYVGGGYAINREGVLSGEKNAALIDALAERGYVAK